MNFCDYCGGAMPPQALKCQNCGGPRERPREVAAVALEPRTSATSASCALEYPAPGLRPELLRAIIYAGVFFVGARGLIK